MTETQQPDSKQIFLQHVFIMMQSGMIQLGKIMNPATQKVEKNLEGTKSIIDILTMLREKTAGNLDKDEKEMLDNAISSLQLNYVDELKSESDKQEVEGKKADEKGASEKEADTSASETDTEAVAKDAEKSD